MTLAEARQEEPLPLQVLVYGAEKKGVIAPGRELTSRNYTLHFEPFDTARRFDEFDGVIVFQGTFERVTHSTTWMGEGLDRHEYEKDELDKRIREFKLLYDGGGFACFLLCEPFFDGDTSRDLRATDLVKYFLLVDNLYRRNFATRVAHVTPVLSDFKRFLDRFGAASSWFETVGWKPRPIATVGRHLVGMVIGQRLFCVPSQLPEAKPGKIHEPDPNTKEFFELLVDGLVVVGRKLAVELPVWVDAYEFDREHDALGQKAVLLEEVSKLEAEIDAFKRFKWILIYDGDDLVDAVRYVLETGFGFAVEAAEEFREDLKILGEDGKPLVFAEVKGTTRGVKREHVNQADSHRERAGLVPTFPSSLS